MIRSLAIFLGFTLLALVGCNDARFVHRGEDEGIVAIPERSNEFPAYYLTNAAELMESHVGPGYEIVEEREVTKGVQEMAQTLQPAGIQQTMHTSSNLTEWQIRYRKKNGVVVGQPSQPRAELLAPPVSVAPAAMNQTIDVPPPNMNGL